MRSAWRIELPGCPLRVYHADTDAAGVAHHSAYLRWFERARADWLAAAGFSARRLDVEYGVAFAVVHVSLNYRRPAELDDDLAIHGFATIGARGVVVADQTVSRGEEILAQCDIKLACVSIRNRTLAPLPAPLRSALVDAHIE
ncbi:YbgC/FadM family acyl-CoA thioesterase [Trinickia acidisoli]|uniref:YbgC/FadM family acyl-CoA thioesterase n=1 Tax=Trinickia acidisoli TaxID=2767482 RepID=UPI001A8FA2CB|nr:YbgC/FadM family acyl-CoA thioesterase [Trinickia acidisoli]